MTYFVFTIDVCWVPGEDFYGQYQGEDYGVPYIVDRLERHGLKGSFFVNPYVPRRLEDKMLSNLGYLVARGQDLQLHTHLGAVDLNRPSVCDYSTDKKRRILEHGVSAIVRAGAKPPVAHRAGGLAIDEETLEILPEFGIKFDSSIYHRFGECRVRLDESQANRVVKVGSVYQLPIMLIRTLPFVCALGKSAFQLDSNVWPQQKSALEQFVDHETQLVTYLLHFFSFYKYEQPERPFEPLIISGINTRQIACFDNVLELVSADRRFTVVTVSQLWDIFSKNPEEFEAESFIPFPGFVPTYAKCWTYWEVSSLNKAVVAAPWLMCVAAAILAVALW